MGFGKGEGEPQISRIFMESSLGGQLMRSWQLVRAHPWTSVVQEMRVLKPRIARMNTDGTWERGGEPQMAQIWRMKG